MSSSPIAQGGGSTFSVNYKTYLRYSYTRNNNPRGVLREFYLSYNKI